MVKIERFTFNVFGENTYIIYDEHSKESAIIDPGCSNKSEEQEISAFIQSKDLVLKYLIITHCHIDHILGIKFIKDKYQSKYLIPEKDLPLIERAEEQGELFNIKLEIPFQPDELLTEETNLKIGDSEFKFLFTPGHSPGEYSIYFPNEKFCITGDVLFRESIGRTDLWGGNYETLINSIKDKLLTLPDDTLIYPGHGEPSTIKQEKNYNPFLV